MGNLHRRVPAEPGVAQRRCRQTWRRMERLSFTNADTQETTETDKRHFRKIWHNHLDRSRSSVDTTVEVVRASRVHVDLYDRAN